MKVLVQDPSSTVLWLGLEASTTSSPSGLVWICSSPDTSSSHTWTSTWSAAPAAGSSSLPLAHNNSEDATRLPKNG